MQACSVSEPSSLATYSLSSAAGNASSSRRLPPVSATYTSIPRKEEGWVTITAQADGIHIMDLSNNQPVASHTLGPATFFSAPAVTLISETKNANATRTTYAVIDASPETESKLSGKTVWIWTESVEQNIPSTSQEKKVATISHRIKNLLVVPSSTHLIALSPDNILSTLSTEFQTIATLKPRSTSEIFLRSWTFRQHECTFVAASDPGTVLVRAVGDAGSKTFLDLDTFDLGGNATSHRRVSLDFRYKDIADLSLIRSGHFSLLTRSGEWHSFTLELDEASKEGIQLVPSEISLKLRSLAISGSFSSSHPLSLLALNTSHVLLASTSSTSPPELVLQIWDLRYGVLLCSSSSNIPAALSAAIDSGSSIRAELITSTSSQFVLVLSPETTNSSPSKSKSRSSVFVVPYTVPRTSNIANVLGLAHSPAMAKWIEPPSALHEPANGEVASGTLDPSSSSIAKNDASREALLSRLQVALADPLTHDDAQIAFFEWADSETARFQDASKLPKVLKSPIEKGDEVAAEDVMDTEPDPVAPLSNAEITTQPLQGVYFSHGFVVRILILLLEGKSTSSATEKILRALLLRRVVMNNMIQTEGGLIRRLCERGDWTNVQLSLKVIRDLPEEEIIRILKLVVTAAPKRNSRKKKPQPTEETMAIDSGNSNSPKASGVPSLTRFLIAVLLYPTSPAALRTALRRHFSEAGELMPILQQLKTWVERWCGMHLEKQVSLDSRPARFDKAELLRPEPLNTNRPPLENVLNFLSILLDASFLNLVRHTEAHDVLISLGELVRPEVQFLVTMDKLRGPLEPFVRAQRSRAKKAQEPADQKGQPAPVDVRAAKRAARPPPAVVGLYQLEELVL